MSKSLITRRSFAKLSTASVGAVLAGKLNAQSAQALPETSKEITTASVPGDPQASVVRPGTVHEPAPFDGELTFARKNLRMKVQPFPMTQVRLLPSVFKDAQDANLRYLHELKTDQLLHSFRLTAGLPSNAQPLGGWEKPDGELRGHFAGGHYLSGLALAYASTGDEVLKSKAGTMVAVLAECQSKMGNGYLSAYPSELFDRLRERKKVWAPFYTLHKIMAGLLDVNQYCGNAQALEVLKGIADWTDKWTAALTEAQMQSVLDTEYGGMNDVLYNLAVVTGNEHYVAVGDRFTKKRFFNPLALQRDELIGLHTNTHIPQVIGAARRYEISCDTRFRDVTECFWREVVETRTYATGGTSNNEGWLVGPNRLSKEITLGTSTNECCCAYNMMKLTRTLYTWTADVRFFDFYERLMYNHRLGTIDPHTSMTQYYLGIVPGSWRTFGSPVDSFWCCNGTGVEEFSKLNDSIYFHDDDSLFVNLFIPSELHWPEKGLRLRQQNNFPEQASTALTIDTAAASPLTLKLRIPTWVSSAPVVKINGQQLDATASPGSYLSVRRTWKKGDTIQIELPMSLYVEPMADDPQMQAVFYGPILLAGELGNEGLTPELIENKTGPADLRKHPYDAPVLRSVSDDVSSWMQPGKEPLVFHTVQQQRDITFKPFHAVNGQRYSVYWRVTS
jgi:DUF1680 family protein